MDNLVTGEDVMIEDSKSYNELLGVTERDQLPTSGTNVDQLT